MRITREIINLIKNRDNVLNLNEKDVKSITKGLGEILLNQKITEGLSNEQLKQFGITEQEISERVGLLSQTMDEANARVIAGYSILFSWFGQRQTELKRSAENKARENGLLGKTDDTSRTDNEETSILLQEGTGLSRREQSDGERVSTDISRDSEGSLRLDHPQYQSDFDGSRYRLQK